MVSPCSINMSPLWGFGYLVYAVFYKHAAPLGVNATQFAARYSSWGRGYLARWVGEPNPYGCSFGCSRSNFRASRILVRHVAPLGLNATQLAARYHRGGEVTSPDGLGNPTPTDAASVAHVPIFVPPVSWCGMSSLGAKCGSVSSSTNPTPTILRLLTFSCLPYLGAACRPSGAKCLTFPFSLSCFSLLRVLLRLCGESYHVTFHFP